MKTKILSIFFLIAVIHSDVIGAEGNQLFRTRCAACHTIGGGKMVGPDLKGVNERRSANWIRSFVKSSSEMIKSGDAEAVAIFNEYNQILMPDHPDISDADIDAIAAYIKDESVSIVENPESQVVERSLGVSAIDIQRPRDKNSISINDPSFKMTYWFIATILVVFVFAMGGMIARLSN